MPSLSIQAVVGAEQVAQKGEASMVSAAAVEKRSRVAEVSFSARRNCNTSPTVLLLICSPSTETIYKEMEGKAPHENVEDG